VGQLITTGTLNGAIYLSCHNCSLETNLATFLLLWNYRSYLGIQLLRDERK